jgi:hypothetical protein
MAPWWNKRLPTLLDEAEHLASSPSGGRFKMWLLGVVLALIPAGYGVFSLITGNARFFGRQGSHVDLDGAGGIALSIAYIAVGVFIHAHWFWGLHPRLELFSPILKLIAVLAFLVGFGYAMYRVIA